MNLRLPGAVRPLCFSLSLSLALILSPSLSIDPIVVGDLGNEVGWFPQPSSKEAAENCFFSAGEDGDNADSVVYSAVIDDDAVQRERRRKKMTN